MEYLKIAQDLDMYGVNYFLIRVSQCCFAISLQCKPIGEISRRVTFTVVLWNEVREKQSDSPALNCPQVESIIWILSIFLNK